MIATGTLTKSHIDQLPARGKATYKIWLDVDGESMSFLTTRRDYWEPTERMKGKRVRVWYSDIRGTLWFNRVEEVR